MGRSTHGSTEKKSKNCSAWQGEQHKNGLSYHTNGLVGILQVLIASIYLLVLISHSLVIPVPVQVLYVISYNYIFF